MDLKRFNRHQKNTKNFTDLESSRQSASHSKKIAEHEFSDLPDKSTEYEEFREEAENCASERG